MKICAICREEKPATDYTQRSVDGKTYPRAYCKPCYAEYERGKRKHRGHAAYLREWRSRVPGRNRAALAKRRALLSTPKWANAFFIEEAYRLAAQRTSMLGFPWHVDHIVPLQHPLVCGLHNEFNLAVIPAVQNMAKGNRYWPGMP